MKCSLPLEPTLWQPLLLAPSEENSRRTEIHLDRPHIEYAKEDALENADDSVCGGGGGEKKDGEWVA